jgi:hypothetical protein
MRPGMALRAGLVKDGFARRRRKHASSALELRESWRGEGENCDQK